MAERRALFARSRSLSERLPMTRDNNWSLRIEERIGAEELLRMRICDEP